MQCSIPPRLITCTPVGLVTKAACTCETPQPTGTPVRQPNRRRMGFLKPSWYNPPRGELMANFAGVLQQLRKERDQAARVVERLDAALAALDGGSYGKRTGNRRH